MRLVTAAFLYLVIDICLSIVYIISLNLSSICSLTILEIVLLPQLWHDHSLNRLIKKSSSLSAWNTEASSSDTLFCICPKEESSLMSFFGA